MLGLGDNLAQSASALRAYRLRSTLTIIGLVMGVATIIGVISLIRGANWYIEEKVANLGTNVFQIAKTPFVATNFEQVVRSVKYRRIGEDELQFLAAKCQNCAAVGATVNSSARARRRNADLPDIQLQGATASMANIDPRVLDKGRFFTPSEEERSAYVCLIGDSVREQLFGASDPIGQAVRLGSQEFLVVGTFAKIGSVLGQDSDTFAVLPLTTFARIRGARQTLTLNIKAASAESLTDALNESRSLLRSKRQVRPGQPDDFFIGTRDSYIALWTYMSGAFFNVFVVVSLITTIVGGIVIMNVMLVSVTERAKEIGLRRAMGATQRDIRAQFLTESLVQCLIGGALGVVAGFLAAQAVRSWADFPVRVELWVALFGVGLSSLIGLFFGMAPAIRAARLDPVEALRTE
jgi:putative ABC transport system permease protein